MKIFISYAHVDEYRVREMVDILRNARFDPWFDHSLAAGRPWEDQLFEAIQTCDRFLYALTPESVGSKWCRWEFAQAVNMGKPVIPVLIQANTPLDDVLNRIQYADFSKGPTPHNVARLMADITAAECIPVEWVPVIPVPHEEPERPVDSDDSGPSIVDRLFDDTREAFRAKDYEHARDLLLACLDIVPDHAGAKALLKRVEARRTSKQTSAPPPKSQQPRQPVRSRSLDLLPAPFDWIEIPATAERRGFGIAKYPVTNAQFAQFIEAGGYRESKWWTDAGWKAREEGWHYDGVWTPSGTPWTEPRFWKDSKWNGAEQPVVGVSWYEAAAFCLWLSETTGEKIMLPTEDQWQHAAQGDDGRTYPWGDEWDCKRCNNSVKPCDSNATTPVAQYEGKGESDFGLVDMAGNVWEWCLTDYDNKTNDINSDANRRVLRGGSWNDYNPDDFRCDCRGWGSSPSRGNYVGFRVSRS